MTIECCEMILGLRRWEIFPAQSIIEVLDSQDERALENTPRIFRPAYSPIHKTKQYICFSTPSRYNAHVGKQPGDAQVLLPVIDLRQGQRETVQNVRGKLKECLTYPLELEMELKNTLYHQVTLEKSFMLSKYAFFSAYPSRSISYAHMTGKREEIERTLSNVLLNPRSRLAL